MPPTFCRHNRFVENCPICSKKERTKPGTVTGAASTQEGARRTSPAQARHAASGAVKRRTPKASAQLTVRRMNRAADDGYENDLVPGLRSSVDAGRLADELAHSIARLQQLREAPPGLYAEIAELGRAGETDEALWTCFLTAYLSPLEGTGDPFSAIAAARVSWASGELPQLDGIELGPRTAHDPAKGERMLVAYRAWAQKGGGQHLILAGDESWEPTRRFDRAYERLALPGFGRVPRYEFVTLAGALGLIDAVPQSLLLADATAAPTMAAKRIFGIGDPILIARRAGELAAEAGVSLACFDFALQNWMAPEDEEMAAGTERSPAPDPQLRAPIARALRVG
ncbi:MAG: hypothetical protein H0V81_09065 [Solirubrobacterales bacterium]|nr:hypothetical protein [Solirubrobacterales bacterium]